MTNGPFILNFDSTKHAVLEANAENLPYHFPEKCLFAFVTKDNIVSFLKKRKCREIGEFVSVSFNSTVYELNINNEKIALCQAPVGSSAAVYMFEWLLNYGVKKVLAVGSAGVLVDLPENKFFLVQKALRDEGTSLHYLPLTDFINLDQDFIKQVDNVARKKNLYIEKVTTWTTDGFFRETAKKVTAAQELGCQLVEMECSALAACAQFRKIQFGQILFTADSLANINQHESRNWGRDSRTFALEIGLEILSELNINQKTRL